MNDLFLGVPSLIFDLDVERRKLYGNLGDFRIKSYGIEYRTMGIGMYLHKDIVTTGINQIKANLTNVKELKERYWELMKELDSDINNMEKQNKIWQEIRYLYMEL